MRRFEGKVVIVTGAGSGIGEASALRFAAEGGAVGVADINGNGANAVVEQIRAAGGKAVPLVADVSDAAAVEGMVAKTVEEFGGLDVIHNNAALLAPDVLSRDLDLGEFDHDVFERTMAVNVLGPMLACKYGIPRMLERGGGAIVNTISVAALRGEQKLPIYGMSKAALASLTRFVATQYGKRNIRCNAVAPGTTLTPASSVRNDPERMAKRLEDVLTVRLGEPRDIAATAVFLASDDAAYITGQVIVADGGRTIHS
jgi:NAD(P)-dependent dehydrogenase (short-subunit alcohol dehydrogenase family)